MFKLIAVFLFTVSSLATEPEERPFWRKKSSLLRQIVRDRRVVVSVKKKTENFYRAVGVGMVNGPFEKCFQEILKFENLPQISSHFRMARHDRQKKNLYLKLQALGYVAHMLLDYRITLNSSQEKQLDWKVISGSFRGMVGHFRLEPVNAYKTEVSFWAHFAEPKFPLPRFFLTFTLEVIAEKVAQKMRTYLEYQIKELRQTSPKSLRKGKSG